MSTKLCEHLSMTVPSDPRYLPMVRAIAQQGASLAGFEDEDCHNIVLAVTEALTNVIRHAYQGDSDRRIDLVLQADKAGFRLDIIDYGEFIDPALIASRPLDEIRPGGLGVYLMKTTMDEVEYIKNTHGGTTLTLVKTPNPPKESS